MALHRPRDAALQLLIFFVNAALTFSAIAKDFGSVTYRVRKSLALYERGEGEMGN